MKKQSARVHFVDKLEKLPELDWQNKKRKHRRTTLTEENRKNTIIWQIDSWEKLFTEIDRNSDRILKIILDIPTIYTKYLNQANNADKLYNQIWIVALGLEQELQISNNEKAKAITLLEAQVTRLNWYKKIIDMFQNSFFAKKDQSQQSIE